MLRTMLLSGKPAENEGEKSKFYLWDSMKKKECTSCAMMIDEKAEVCPICEYEFPAQRNYRPWLLVMLILIFLMMVFNWIRPMLHLK